MRSFVKSRLALLGLAACCALATGSAVHAQEASADQKAIENRKAIFTLIGWQFDPVGKMLRGQRPYDAALVQQVAARLETFAPMIPEAFATDTRGKAAGVATRARESIWTKGADFKAKNDEFVKAVAGLSAAAKDGDEKSFKQAAAAVGKSCGGCHDGFRER